MAYAVVTSLMTTLEQVLQFNPSLISKNIKAPVDSLYGTLTLLQAFLEDMGRINDQQALTFLEKKITDSVYKAEDTVELCLRRIHLAGNRDNQCKLFDELQQIGKIMDSIQQEVVKFKNDHQHIKDQLPSTNASSSRVLDEENTLSEMDDVFNNIRDQLTGQASELNVVSIVGMGGIGKTTLAKSIFSNQSIVCRFDVSSWVIVSQEYDAREMLLDVLSFGTPGVKLIFRGKTYDQLLELVYKKLKCRRYLIVLDDIWSIEAWDIVKRSFPDDNNGSRIMITTRLLEVADCASNGFPPHHVPFLNSESSWNLLSDKVFRKEGCPPQLEEIGKQIARHCKGLPLSVVVIAGLLSKIPRTFDDWKKVAENVISHLGSTFEQCLAILALSYNYLPCSLKACFLYMGFFAENADIPADKLIRLWVSEGFLKITSHKKLEEVAEECLVDLVSRSLIMVSRRGASGKIRSIRIHDLVRLLCLREGEAAKFFHVKDESLEVSPEGKQIERRLCLHPDALQEKNLGLEKDSLDSVRTILCLGEPHAYLEDSECCKIIISRFQLLRVLDLESIRFSCFPSEITQLIQLRYVAFTTGTDVPASISNLRNLQTLIVLPVKSQLSLPQEVWKLSCLRHFNPGGMCVHAPPTTHNFVGLENLETVDSMRTTNSNWKETFSAVPRVQKLGVLIHPDHHEWSKLIDSLVSLADLQRLRIHLAVPSSVEYFQRLLAPLQVFPTNLKSLTLVGTHLPWEDMTMLGNIPNLEVLRLKTFAFQGRNWNLNEGGFKKLKLLHIFMTNLVHWEATSDSLPNLECLILRHCYYLEEVPTEIGDIPTLELIELHHCSQDAVTSAEEILEEQRSYGNEVLVVRTCDTGVQYFDMKCEGDEEVTVASTSGSDMTYNHTSNMANKIVTKMRTKEIGLKHTNEDLLKLIGQHKNRFIEDEELTYLCWIAGCIRYELRSVQAEILDRDLSKRLSPRSEEKAKQLILEHATSELSQGDTELESKFSLPSSPGSEDFDNTSIDSPTSRYSSSKPILFQKLRNIIQNSLPRSEDL